MRGAAARRAASREDTAGSPALGVRQLDPSTGWRWWLVGLFFLALAWRLLWLYRLGHTPLADSLDADARAYWDWASFLRKNGLLGKNPFFMGPLYPYGITVLRAAFGDSITPILVVQCVLGAAAITLLTDTVCRMTRPAVGFLIGTLLAGYEMAVFFDGLLLMESLLFFIEALFVWLVMRREVRNWSNGALGVTGLLVGLLACGRATSALLLIPVALLVFEESRSWRLGLRRLLPLGSAFAAVCLPVAIRNYVVAGECIPLTYGLGYNLYVGNNPDATGSFVVVTGAYDPADAAQKQQDGGVAGDGRGYILATTGLHLSPAASSRHWAHQALVFVRHHPLQTARLAARKAAMFWNSREYPQIESIEVHRAVVGPAGIPLLGRFACLGVLAIAGMLVAWRAGPRGRFALAYVATMTLAVMPFFVTDRYRHHLVPGAALLAGFALAEGLALLERSSVARAARLGTGLLVGIGVVNLPLPGLDATRTAWDIAFNLGARWLERNHPDRALPYLERAIRIDQSGALVAPANPTAQVTRAALYENDAIALRELDRLDAAVASYEQALRLAPQSNSIALGLADTYALCDRLASARALYGRVGVAPAEAAKMLAQRAWEASRRHRLGLTERYLRAAVEFDPQLQIAWVPLVRLYADDGRLEAAEATLQRVPHGRNLPTWWAHQALVAIEGGDAHRASRALAQVSDSALASDPGLLDVVRYVRQSISLRAVTPRP